MEKMPQAVLTSALAPTVLPLDVAGSPDMYFKPTYSTTPIMSYPYKSTYTVLLSSPKHPLASFSDMRFANASQAQIAIEQSFGNQPVPATAQSVSLGYDITAKQFTDSVTGSVFIEWTEGRWTVRVSGTTAPTKEASAVAEYMHSHFLPAPETSGAVQVVVSSAGVSAAVGWTQDGNVYVVHAQPGAKDPAWTAMGMAISMRSY